MSASLQPSYDQIAAEYARRIADELQPKPLDQKLLDRFVAETREAGPVGSVGCGVTTSPDPYPIPPRFPAPPPKPPPVRNRKTAKKLSLFTAPR